MAEGLEYELLDELDVVAANLPPVLQEHLRDNLHKWRRNRNKLLSMLVIGRTGSGKTTLMKGMLGVPKEGGNAREGVYEVPLYYHVINGVSVTVWEGGSGLQDGVCNRSNQSDEYLHLIKKNCSDVDLVFYCIKMTDARITRSNGNPDVAAMRELTEAFGNDFWRKVVIVLTYANILEAMNLDWEDLSDEDKGKAFNDNLKEWARQLKIILSEEIGVPNKIVDDIRIVPAGHVRRPHLPGIEYWLSNLWFRCFYADISPNTRCAILQVNLQRFQKLTRQIESEDFEKDVTVKVRNMVMGGSVNGGVFGGVVGGVVGGPIGAVIGAGIGAFLGGGTAGGIVQQALS